MSEPTQRTIAAKAEAGGFVPDGIMAGEIHEIIPYGIFTTDRELRVKNWNQWLTTHSGLKADQVIGRRLTELFPDLETRRLLSRYNRALEGEISVLSAALHKFLLPFPVTVPESGLPHMLQTARIAPLREEDRVAGTITIIEDVTQREFQAGILNRQQDIDRMLSHALATLLQADDPVQEMEAIFTAVRLALGLDTYLGYLLAPDQKSLQLHTAVGLPPKVRQLVAVLPFTENDRRTLRGEVQPAALSIGLHHETLHASGLRAQGSFSLAVGEQIIGLVSFGSYQQDLILPSDLTILARISRYVAIAIDRARRERNTHAASRAKDDFLAALSHELRTPLNPVLLVASDAAANDAFPDEAREAFRQIEKNVKLEARLIDDLLDLTRITHGKLNLTMQSFDVYGSVRDALQTVRGEMAFLSLHNALPADQVRIVRGDHDRLQQVFWNVLKNAVKFTPKDGKVSITSSVNPTTNEIAIAIRDSGVGMEPHELARVFEAFAQGDHAGYGRSHRFGGLGLGLAISRKIVELHGGRIEAASAGRDRGSTFTIYLPLLATPVAVAPAFKAPLPASPDTSSPFQLATRILLVEDHEPTRSSLRHLLERRGYSVIAVPSAAAALKAAALGSFNLVLSDIGLPDDNGFALMKKLRDAYGLKGIALTGYGMEGDLEQSREAGFFAHLTKPISVSTLERTLAQFFEKN